MTAPDDRLNWDFSVPNGREFLNRYQLTILQGVKAGAKKVTKMSKTAEVLQKPDEFHERICEVFRVYPKARENQHMGNATFMAQPYTDIRLKLQKSEGFAGMNSTQLLQVTNKEAQNVAAGH